MAKQRIPLQKVFVTVTMPTVGILPWLKMEQTWKLSTLLSKQLKLQANHLWLKWRTVMDMVLQTNKELMLYTVPSWSRWNCISSSPWLGLWTIWNSRTSICWLQRKCCRPWPSTSTWTKLVADYKETFRLVAEVAIIDGRDPVEVTQQTLALRNGFSQATHNSSQDALNVVVLNCQLSWVDQLTKLTQTWLIKTDGLQDDSNRLNRNIQFGVREFAWERSWTDGFTVVFVYTVELFFVFSDYVKAAVPQPSRTSCDLCLYPRFNRVGKMIQRTNQLSIGVFVPCQIENVFRPADARETQAAWYLAVQVRKHQLPLSWPSKLDCRRGTDFDKVAKGAYVVYEMQQTLIPSWLRQVQRLILLSQLPKNWLVKVKSPRSQYAIYRCLW